jgi:GrpB-like predicted nucleotidyltransferase (UPF0157 family)
MSLVVEVVDYSTLWPRMFEEERCRIIGVLAPVDIIDVIEHIGSTAVPHLAAKPVIDILLGVTNLDILDVRSEEPWNAEVDKAIEPVGPAIHRYLVQALEMLGYVYRGEADIAGRLFFRKNTGQHRTHHVHVAQTGGAFWNEHLLFRDYLRTHPEWAKVYGEKKRKLALEQGHSRAAYTDAKGPLITELLSKARAWKDRGGI